MKISVLLVDDEKDFIELLGERLSARGLEVSTAFNGNEALLHIRRSETDVVILDVLMPGKDGVSILREIRQDSPLVQVIMLTGHGSIESAVEGMKAGAYDYVMKPVEIDVLVEKISSAFAHRTGLVERIGEAEAAAEREKESMNKRIEAERLASVGELASGIAHEINNPVAVMVEEAGWVRDLLDDENPDIEEIRRALKQISIQGVRCKEITHKLLSFGRKTDPVLRKVQVSELISNLLGDFKKSLKFGNIEVVTDLAPDIPSIMASPSELQQVFANILNNAIDAIGHGAGRIAVATRTDGEHIEVKFSDTGHGMSEEVLARIFEPFYTTRPVGHGTGLGLAICHGIVQRLGGRIAVCSKAGSGTKFSVFLPLPKS